MQSVRKAEESRNPGAMCGMTRIRSPDRDEEDAGIFHPQTGPLAHAGLALYCVALFLVSILLIRLVSGGEEKQRPVRSTPIPSTTTALQRISMVTIVWGGTAVPIVHRQSGVQGRFRRGVPLKASSHRVLLIGDSFAEGIGVSFEETRSRASSIAPGSSAGQRSSFSTPASRHIPRASITRRSSICSTVACSSTKSCCFPTVRRDRRGDVLFLHRRRSEIPRPLHFGRGLRAEGGIAAEAAGFLGGSLCGDQPDGAFLHQAIDPGFARQPAKENQYRPRPHRLDGCGPRRR